MKNDLLVISDFAGYGKVALSVMIPVLAHLGIKTHSLPTAIVSNTLDYGQFEIVDLTDYMRKTLNIWQNLNFNFDAIATGFIVNDEQVKIVKEVIAKAKLEHKLVLCDPIMGDDGHLYPGMNDTVIANMRSLIAEASYIIPNYTEATFLTGDYYLDNPSEQDIRQLIDHLRAISDSSIAITSAKVAGQSCVACYDKTTNTYFNLPYELIDVRFPGTGDIFSSMMLGSLLNRLSMEESVSKAMNAVKRLILKNIDQKDKYRGIPIEENLKELD